VFIAFLQRKKIGSVSEKMASLCRIEDPEVRTIWIVDAQRDNGKRFVVHADEILTAFLELELAILQTRHVQPNLN
jgi:hypothetical protein